MENSDIDNRIELISREYHDLGPDGVSWAESGSRYRNQIRKKVRLVLMAEAYVDKGLKRYE